MGEGGGDHEDDGIEHVMPQRPDSFDCLGSRPWESIYVAVGSGASSAWVSSIRRMSVSLHGQRHGVAFTTRSDDLCARGRVIRIVEPFKVSTNRMTTTWAIAS